ncbi:MspA family porin [Mycobacteroides chelonae]|uniref:MspA family porin n=1 Tax=Mycobacteroides chelonae TaxID=1774 RepID=UPI0009BE302B|nr:MspA family porin [Mycobacteroides chelonae]QQG85938.1 hypothetical protein HBA99_00685 [Mycobacteroides chelonae]QQG90755.1 hypothetical protein HBA97_00685 [Mycobacteroides chelonae]
MPTSRRNRADGGALFHIYRCIGQSFLRSYAVLTSTTSGTEDIIAYYGVTKTV